MARRDDLFKEQIEQAETRYEQRKPAVERRAKHLGAKGDWREVEDAGRVLRRMLSLGMEDLAGAVMARETPADAVASARHPDERVSLLERIIEENDLVSSRFLHLGSVVARAVGRILIRSRGRTVGYGTGFLVSRELVLTNHHVLPTSSVAGRSAVEFDYFERANGATGPTLLVGLEPDLFFLTDERLDFTLVGVAATTLDGRPRPENSWIPLIPESGKALVGEPVNLIQHPGGKPQQIAIKNNEVVDVVGDFLHYRADTQKGSSGACVLNMQWELAALHHAGVPKRDDQERILLRDGSVWDGTQDTADHIDWIANEGVRISSIVRAVREMLADEEGPERAVFEAALAEMPPLSSTVPAPFPDADPSPPLPPPQTPSVPADRTTLDDDTLDRLTPEEIAELVADQEPLSFDVTREAAAPGEVIVAEGDSWFDYSLAGLDIIDCLKAFFGHRIHNVARAGDTLDNMAWGTDFHKRRWYRERPPLEDTLDAVRRYQPRVFLLSAGGNDVAGDEFSSYLNHKVAGIPPLREDFVEFMISDYFRRAFAYIMNRVWEVDPTIHVITHGYGHAPPDGRGVIRLLGMNWIGPWLRPALTAKGYTAQAERERIVHDVIDRFNAMLRGLARDDARGRVHYLDLRPLIRPTDWVNELHLKNSAYRRVAAAFDREIRLLV